MYEILDYYSGKPKFPGKVFKTEKEADRFHYLYGKKCDEDNEIFNRLIVFREIDYQKCPHWTTVEKLQTQLDKAIKETFSEEYLPEISALVGENFVEFHHLNTSLMAETSDEILLDELVNSVEKIIRGPFEWSYNLEFSKSESNYAVKSTPENLKIYF